MISTVVIDASIAASWVIPDEKNAVGEQLADDLWSGKFRPITASLFWYEFCNVFITNVRRGRVSSDDLLPFLQELHDLGVETREMDDDRKLARAAIFVGLELRSALQIDLL